MTKRYRLNKSDAMLSTDMDFSALAGPRCICIKNYKMMAEKKDSTSKGGKDSETISYASFETGGGSNSHMIEIKEGI